MAWRTAYSLDTLLDEVNRLYPGRDKRTDGAISGYPGATSSHNVNSQGVVCARDITTGDYPGGISPADGMALAEQIRVALKVQPRGNPAYIIHHMEPPYVPYAGPWIAHGISDWEWYFYTGSDPHTSHIHVSVDWDIPTGGAPSGEADYDTRLAWGLTQNGTSQVSGDTSQEDDMPSIEELKGAFLTKEDGAQLRKDNAQLRADMNTIVEAINTGFSQLAANVAAGDKAIVDGVTGKLLSRDDGAYIVGKIEAVPTIVKAKDVG